MVFLTTQPSRAREASLSFSGLATNAASGPCHWPVCITATAKTHWRLGAHLPSPATQEGQIRIARKGLPMPMNAGRGQGVKAAPAGVQHLPRAQQSSSPAGPRCSRSERPGAPGPGQMRASLSAPVPVPAQDAASPLSVERERERERERKEGERSEG